MKPRSNRPIVSAVTALSMSLAVLLSGGPSAPAADSPQRIDPGRIQIGGEIGRRIDVTIENNLMKLDVEDGFLQPFRTNAGQAFIGLGMLIDSAVRFAAYSGDPQVVELKNHLVEETLKTQEEDGYIGMMPPRQRMWRLWDIHEMAYIANGLVSDYRFFGNRESLEAARRLMDYVMRRWSANPDGLKPNITVFMAVTGLEETLLMLHEATGDERYLDFVADFRRLPEWDTPVVLGRWGPIAGHAYAYMHRCLAQLRLHRVRPDPKLLEQTRGLLRFLREGDGLLVNGTVSKYECWTDNQDGSEGLGETCATAYLIRLCDQLLRMRHDSLYGDVMERSIYNGLFGAQSPDGRKLRYYTPFEGPREYFPRDSYCCPNNYRRIVSELPMMVYYRFGKGLAVNLYAPSQARVELRGGPPVSVRQETDYPNSGDVTIHLDPSREAEFPVFLRIPRWCEEARISINGEPAADAVPGGQFCRLERTWKEGHRIELRMPMPLRLVKGRKMQAGQVAVMRGPQLFCLGAKRNEALRDADLEDLHVDPDTLTGPEPDDTVRPDGQMVRVKGALEMPFAPGVRYDLELVLTESADPSSRTSYFNVLQVGTVGAPDELIPHQ